MNQVLDVLSNLRFELGSSVPMERVEILMFLNGKDKPTAYQSFCYELAMTRNIVSRNMKALVRHDLVKVGSVKDDKRIRTAILTKRGREIMEALAH